MSESPVHQPPVHPTALGASSRDTITLLGHDLTRDVMGSVGFGELALRLATQHRPSSGEVRGFEAVLAASPVDRVFLGSAGPVGQHPQR